jgi:hypothetical protein
VVVELELRQPGHLLREVRFRTPGNRFTDFVGDGEIESNGSALSWLPPVQGGTLRWRVSVPHLRNGNGHDAWLGENWGLFRAEDIIPSAVTRTLKGARSVTRLAFDLPDGWSVTTEYAEDDGMFIVRREQRRFKQPKGWIVMGDLGVRRDSIAGIRVTVAAPVDNGVRRLDILALLNWTLPELARIVADLPPRITIVSAGKPMWRGGLSAPASLYMSTTGSSKDSPNFTALNCFAAAAPSHGPDTIGPGGPSRNGRAHRIRYAEALRPARPLPRR